MSDLGKGELFPENYLLRSNKEVMGARVDPTSNFNLYHFNAFIYVYSSQ